MCFEIFFKDKRSTDIPLVSEFDTTLFAADKDLTSLKNKVNNQLKCLYNWFLRYKLSINFGKANFLLINKTPYRPIAYNFKIMIDDTFFKQVENVKYLGGYINELLNWPTHTFISFQLAKYSGMFYRLQNYVTRESLIMLYHSLIHSRIQYGLISWGTAAKTYLMLN